MYTPLNNDLKLGRLYQIFDWTFPSNVMRIFSVMLVLLILRIQLHTMWLIHANNYGYKFV